ncbi:Uncharacterised protein [Plesiomonas shigelloides]|nr:Uncharacterised protein [Plesiomonas shigelloides]
MKLKLELLILVSLCATFLVNSYIRNYFRLIDGREASAELVLMCRLVILLIRTFLFLNAEFYLFVLMINYYLYGIASCECFLKLFMECFILFYCNYSCLCIV